MTSTLFGDPANQARTLEAQMLQTNRTGLQNIINDEKTNVVNKLQTWEQKFAQDVDKFVNSGGMGHSSSGSGGQSGQGSQGTESNPTVVTTTGDGPTGLFSGTQSQGNLAAGVTTGLDNSAVLSALEKNSGTLNTQSQEAADSVSQAVQTGQGSSAPSSLASSGSNLIASLLGPLMQIPGMSKALSSQTGQTISTIAGGAAEGFGIGTMIGGAGSTNSDFGALGGSSS